MASLSLLLFSLLLSSISLVSLASYNGGITVDLFHRDSHRSPAYDPSSTRFDRIRNAFDRSIARKAFLSSMLSKSTDAFDATISRGGGEYLMTVKLGTPPVEQLLIADTGSDLLWTQCKPCMRCYKQELPLFDPSRTSSYRTISCDSDQCSADISSSCYDGSRCRYTVQYGDQSHSNGDLATETLTLGPGASFPKVTFGCGHDNAGTFSGAESGIIGLGGGSVSIINQLQSSIGGKFSYCLTANQNSTSKISFGSDAVVGGSGAVSTPLVQKSPATFYYLTLTGVSVGSGADALLSVGEASASVDDGNIIIDSGTTLTFLPSDIYEGVESALKEAITAAPVSDPQGSFQLCYEIDGEGEFNVPPITAHFEGADLVLPQGSIFVEVEQGLACLALVPSENLAIFGNLHQINYKIGYDLVSRQVSFLKTDCSKSE